MLTLCWAMFSSLAQLSLAFQKYSCTLAILAKIAAFNHFLNPLTCARKDPPCTDLLAVQRRGSFLLPPQLLWWQEVAREQKLPARHEQQPWKAQAKKENGAANCKQKQDWENGSALSLAPAFHSKSLDLSETLEGPQDGGINPAEEEQGNFIRYKWFPKQH